MDRIERYRGALLGLAAGDAVGSVPVMLRLHPQYRQLLPQLDKAIQQLQDNGKLR